MTKRKKLSAPWIAKPFKGFPVYYVFKKLKKLKLLQLITKQKNYLLNGFQNQLKNLKSDYFVFKKGEEIEKRLS